VYLNGDCETALRSVGALKALEENLGRPLCLVSTGIGSLIAAYYAFFGLEQTADCFSSFGKELCGSLKTHSLINLGKETSKASQMIEDFLILVKSQQSKKKLQLSNSKRFSDFVDARFGFVEERKSQIPVFASAFDLPHACEVFLPIHDRTVLKGATAFLPFFEPIRIGDRLVISTDSFQGVASRYEPFADHHFHVCLDAGPDEERAPFESAMQILLAADLYRTLELKRRVLRQFNWVIKLNAPVEDSRQDVSVLYEEGYQGVRRFLRS